MSMIEKTTIVGRGFGKGAIIFCGCVLATLSLPFLALALHPFLPSVLVNLLFFSTQIVFPYDTLVVREPFGFEKVFGHGTALGMNILHWCLVTVLFAWVTTRIGRIRYLVPLSILTILLMTILSILVFYVLGMEGQLEGP